MKNGILKLTVFEVLDEVATRLRVNDTMWAKVSGIGASSRISEFRLKAKHMRDGNIDGAKAVGRAFSVVKCKQLVDALKRICGDELVKKEIVDLLNKVETTKERIILIALVLDKEDDEELYPVALKLLNKKK